MPIPVNHAADYAGATRLVHAHLLGLSTDLFYHGIAHTFVDVVPCAQTLAIMEKCSEEECLLVCTAALFHDTGFLDQYEANEPFGVARAKKYLPQFGYTAPQIEYIETIIMATQAIGPGHQHPGVDKLCRIMCDADMFSIGSDVFLHRAEGLRIELQRMRHKVLPIKEWHLKNIELLESHEYFTASARQLYEATKQENIRQIRQMVGVPRN